MTLPTNYFLTREMQRILYALKRQYGGQISIRKLLNSQTDARTGKKTETTKLIPVARAVVLPAHSWRKVVRGISANKDYMAGGATMRRPAISSWTEGCTRVADTYVR